MEITSLLPSSFPCASSRHMGQQRRYPRPPKPLPTLAELRAAGVLSLTITCPACSHGSKFDLASLPWDGAMTTEGMSKKFRCTACPRKGSVSISFDDEPWVQYLRRTGQRDRLPWNACFIPEIET